MEKDVDSSVPVSGQSTLRLFINVMKATRIEKAGPATRVVSPTARQERNS